MSTTYEVRWFFDNAERAIEEWLSHKGFLSAPEKRVDFYLPIPTTVNGLGIKLREGKIEIKQRLPNEHDDFGIPGKVERWQKWSIDMKGDKDLADKIVNDKKFDWIKVPKERFGFKYHFEASNEPKEVTIHERIPGGCQVEYTRIWVNDKEHCTFGFEAFSEKNSEKQNFQKALEKALFDLDHWNMAHARVPPPKPDLQPENSMGYPEFLEKVCRQAARESALVIILEPLY